ncbi:hypothetical protein FOG48_01647 [Hanseniaspora uvarum]|nr:hypothetical protein FOG48_01647 [Hanseniaspora uvarum]
MAKGNNSKIIEKKQNQIKKLLEWAITNDCTIPDLYHFTYDEKKNSVYCKLSKNTSMNRMKLKISPLKIDEKLMLTNTKALLALESHFEKVALEDLRATNTNALIKIFLCCFKNSLFEENKLMKFMSPYLNILPQDNISSTLFWSNEELDIVKNTDLYRKTNILINEIEAEYLKIKNTLKNVKFSFEDYKWAHYIILSRAFPSVVIEDSDDPNLKLKEGMLWPIVDLLNHSNKVKVQWKTVFDNGKKVQYIHEKLEEDDFNVDEEDEFEIFNNYGETKNTEDLIISYGFGIKDLEEDYLTITSRVANKEYVIMCEQIYGVNFSEYFEDEKNPGNYIVRFKLLPNTFPIYLIKFFAVACRLSSEDFISKRSILEGILHLNSTFTMMLPNYKNKLIASKPINQNIIELLKVYQYNSKKILQSALDTLQQYTNTLIDSKTNNDILSYKSELASDKKFQKILNHYLKCSQYKELKKNEESLFNISLLLFIIYCSKKDFSQVDEIEDNTEENTVFIKQNFNKIYKTYEFTDEDYMEYAPTFTPFIENPCEWLELKLEDFIIADIAVDRLTWEKQTNNEVFFIKQEKYVLN